MALPDVLSVRLAEGRLLSLLFLCPLDSVISGGVDRRETQRLRKRNQQLEEENNLLRLKVDILLDMVRKESQGMPRFPLREAVP